MQREFKLSLPQKKQNRTVQAAKPNRGRDSGEQRERGSQRGRQRGEEKTKEQEKNSKKKNVDETKHEQRGRDGESVKERERRRAGVRCVLSQTRGGV